MDDARPLFLPYWHDRYVTVDTFQWQYTEVHFVTLGCSFAFLLLQAIAMDAPFTGGQQALPSTFYNISVVLSLGTKILGTLLIVQRLR